jgi:hypothetical protein
MTDKDAAERERDLIIPLDAAAGRKTAQEPPMTDEPEVALPDDSWKCFALLVSKCASGYGAELLAEGLSDAQARNRIIHAFLAFAAGEACRMARREGREPDREKWSRATADAFERAVARTGRRFPHPRSPR